MIAYKERLLFIQLCVLIINEIIIFWIYEKWGNLKLITNN